MTATGYVQAHRSMDHLITLGSAVADTAARRTLAVAAGKPVAVEASRRAP